MAHRAYGIADLMSDACREAPERCELALLYPLGHESRVLEEDQRGTRSQSQGCEVRLDNTGTIGRDEGGRSLFGLGRLAPRAQGIQEPRRYLPRQRSRNGMRISENLRGAFVDEANSVCGIDHQQTLAQVLHDVLRKLGEVRKIELLLAHEILALAHATRHDACRGRDREEHHAQETGRRISRDVKIAVELLPDRVDEHGKCSECCEEQ